MFKRECPKTVPIESVQFEKLTDNTIGECRMYYLNPLKWEIVIDPRYWAVASEKEKQALLWHEMSHCVLRLPHEEGYRHYMNPEVPENQPYEEFHKQALDNIKTHCK
jgi:hypothetical protein